MIVYWSFGYMFIEFLLSMQATKVKFSYWQFDVKDVNMNQICLRNPMVSFFNLIQISINIPIARAAAATLPQANLNGIAV